MLKVVGASWLQTRISTYILAAVALLGVGAIILGEFGYNKNDGIYAATVIWKQNGGYRIDFWGQGNDLSTVPTGVARAYYKSRIYESGWSTIEIESSASYPDTVQAYAAGLLEGSLTWQVIHHHWHNTVHEPCESRPTTCDKIREHLRENAQYIKDRAEISAATDPYWHMIRLFYAQLDGIEAGWRFAVRRNRKSVEIEPEDFLWLAMASDLTYFERFERLHDSDNESGFKAAFTGMTFLKLLSKTGEEPSFALAHNTAAPYSKMLRLIKRYDLAYHVSDRPGAELVPGRSIVMTSYPGALSSQDEYYAVEGVNRELLVAGTPLAVGDRLMTSRINSKDLITLAPRVMTSNRLATDSRSWSRFLALYNGGTANRQWLTVDPRSRAVWLIEQVPGMTHAAENSEELARNGFLACTGMPVFKEIKRAGDSALEMARSLGARVTKLEENVTSARQVVDLMRGRLLSADNYSRNSTELDTSDSFEISTLRGDLAKTPAPVGVIDTKLMVAGLEGLVEFEAISGPTFTDTISAFNWTKSFPEESHFGHPEAFNFAHVSPQWVWV